MLNAKGLGSCTIRMYLAKPWEFNFNDIENSNYQSKIEIPVEIIEK